MHRLPRPSLSNIHAVFLRSITHALFISSYVLHFLTLFYQDVDPQWFVERAMKMERIIERRFEKWRAPMATEWVGTRRVHHNFFVCLLFVWDAS
jgi:hypothetical protein